MSEPKTELDARGREVLDTTPSNVSLRKQKMVGLSDQMRQVVHQMRHEALQAEIDSEEDEKDFDIESDEPRSPHELFVETDEYQMLMDDIADFARREKNKAPAVEDEKSDSSPPHAGKPAAAKSGNPPPAAEKPEKG